MSARPTWDRCVAVNDAGKRCMRDKHEGAEHAFPEPHESSERRFLRYRMDRYYETVRENEARKR